MVKNNIIEFQSSFFLFLIYRFGAEKKKYRTTLLEYIIIVSKEETKKYLVGVKYVWYIKKKKCTI